MKPIVFIGSVSQGYQDIREAARKAIRKAGGHPLGFENFSALDKSSRNACLDGVRDCDIYVGILGARYGFTTPSGRSATEEEFDEAIRLGKHRLIFVEEVEEYEEKQRSFLKRAGDYQVGRFWKKFKTPEDLKDILEETLKEALANLMKDSPVKELKERLSGEILRPLSNYYNQCWLITASTPNSKALLTDDPSFNKEGLARQIFKLGEEGEIPVFDVEFAKSKELKEDHWLLQQAEHQNWREGQHLTIVRIYLDACIAVAMNVTGRGPESGHDSAGSLYIYPDIVQKIAFVELSFLSRIYQHFDPHVRWDRIALMTALHNLENRNFTRPKPGQTSHPMIMRHLQKPVLVFDEPRVLERSQLERTDYSEAVTASLERKLR